MLPSALLLISLLKFYPVNNAALVDSVRSNAKRYMSEMNWDFANNRAFGSRMPPRVQTIVDTLGLMANRLMTPPNPRRMGESAVQGVKSVRPSTAPEETELYIGSLPYAATEDEIKELFNKIGKVVSLTIIRDRTTGQSKGFGFIGFADAKGAQDCLAGTHYLRGRRIVVNHNNRAGKNPAPGPPGDGNAAPPPPPNPAAARPPPPNAPPDLRFAPPASLGSEIDPHSVYVQNIPPTASDADLTDVFQNWGQVSRAKVVLDPVTKVPKGFGFVTFDSPDDVQKVLAEGSAVMHGVRLGVHPKRIANRGGRSPRFQGNSPRHAPFRHGPRPMGRPPPHASPRGYPHAPDARDMRHGYGGHGPPRGPPRGPPHGQPRGPPRGPPQQSYPPRGSFPPASSGKEATYPGAPDGRPAPFDNSPPASRPAAPPYQPLAPPKDAPGTPEAAPGEATRAPARTASDDPPPAGNTLQSALYHLMSAPETEQPGSIAAGTERSRPVKHPRDNDEAAPSKRKRTAEEPLPHGWIKRQSKRKNRVFYFHIASKQSQWRRPTSSSPPRDHM